jgi:hypothetical protein
MTKGDVTPRSDNEPIIEVSFLRRFNLGNYSHKEYQMKISGTDSQVQQQINDNQDKLIGYLSKLETIVEISNEASALKNKLESKPAEPKTEEAK